LAEDFSGEQHMRDMGGIPHIYKKIAIEELPSNRSECMRGLKTRTK